MSQFRVSRLDRPQILIVEDEEIVLRDLEGVLGRLGYGISGATSSGEKAVELAAAARPDLVLMDVTLRGEMDGVEATRQIRERLDIPVIYLTGDSDEETFQRAKSANASGYIFKPFVESELHVIIEMALYRHDLERELRCQIGTILASVEDGIILVDAENTVSTMNPVAQTLTGWNHEEAERNPLRDVLNIKNRDPQSLSPEHAIQAGIPSRIGTTITTRDGREISVEIRVAPLVESNGMLKGGVVILRDTSEKPQIDGPRPKSMGFDPLTGLADRALFEEQCSSALARSRRASGMLAIILLDIDRVSDISNTFGQDLGSLLLRTVAKRLKRRLRATDTIARLNDSTFAAILEGISRPADAATVGRHVIDIFESSFTFGPHEVFTTAGIGIAVYPLDGESVSTLMRNGGTALNRAKEQGRNTVALYGALEQISEGRSGSRDRWDPPSVGGGSRYYTS